MSSEREPIGVIGAGWVGLVTAACFAELGHIVVCRDIVEAKVESLRRGEVPIYEPGLADMLARNSDRLVFTTDMADALDQARLLFCCVDTPPTYSGDADLSRVQRVVEELGDSSEHAIVMKSTVPVGTGRAITRDAEGLAYVSNPEFLKEGTAVKDFMQPDRVVVGEDGSSNGFGDRVAALYKPLGAEIVRTDVASAEMIKLASNAFLATKISFINEIANVSEELGADVMEVARGMGLDARIGPQFLRAGIGYGGSCFAGDETLLVRLRGQARLVRFEELWELAGGDAQAEDGEAIAPDELEAYSWVPGESEPEFMPVSVLTKRPFEGELVEVRTKMGRRVRVTPDHPFVVGDGASGDVLDIVLAAELREHHWVPLALGGPSGFEPERYPVLGAFDEDGVIPAEKVIVRPEAREIDALVRLPFAERSAILTHPRGVAARTGDVRRSGALRLTKACAAEMDLSGATAATARNGSYVPLALHIDEQFWRVAGLYLAEGCLARAGGVATGMRWSFHPFREDHLVEEVASYWRRHGMKTRVHQKATAKVVTVSSRILAAWWTDILGMGATSYDQRVPDLAWEQSPERKRALLSGLWEGDGSWSLVNGGPSVILEWGTISDELADGVARLLGDVGVVCSWRRGRTAKSTKETHWLRVSGADQVERAKFLVPERDRPGVQATIALQAKRIAPTGYRRFAEGPPWVRVTHTRSAPHRGPVYSLEVPGSHTVAVSGGFICKNCFPKDVSALKQLAGNSGYHFQLLTAVIEVNELQKRRTIGKLLKHLGTLAGKEIALLGVSFKPDTDDVREATSLVLAARLQGEGARVRVYDPIASENARGMLGGAEICESALDALDGADAAVLVTEWPEFRELDWSGEVKRRMKTAVLVDGRNFLADAGLEQAGFAYEGVGR